jgi:SAM-dependent methyltransferase
MTVARQLRTLGLTRENWRTISPRHASLRDDMPALLLRLFRDHGSVDRQMPIPAGLLTADGARARYRIDLVEDLHILSDWPSGDPGEVLPPGETTAILYHATRASRAQSVLDLGCGSGTLGLLLAASGRRVIATDINPRATGLAARNAEVNGIEGVEVLGGSLFEPVAGRRFDLIVCQPPYLPHPPAEKEHTFLHGGRRGDELARRIIQEARHHLLPGGRLVIFSDWPLRAGESLSERIPVEGYHADLRCSVPVTTVSYCKEYGLVGLEAHLHSLGVSHIQQCLAILEPGEGIRTTIVFPHQWAEQRIPY